MKKGNEEKIYNGPPRQSDFWDDSDPRGCSSSEYNAYLKAVEVYKEKQKMVKYLKNISYNGKS